MSLLKMIACVDSSRYDLQAVDDFQSSSSSVLSQCIVAFVLFRVVDWHWRFKCLSPTAVSEVEVRQRRKAVLAGLRHRAPKTLECRSHAAAGEMRRGHEAGCMAIK